MSDPPDTSTTAQHELALLPADDPPPQTRMWLSRLAWVPIPLLLALITGLWIADLHTVHESRTAMVLLNIFFTWLASLCICILTARGFVRSGQPGLLMFGCGSLLWGTTSLAAAIVVDRVNPTITIHNVGVLVAGLCHLVGLMWVGRLKRPGRWLLMCYPAALAGAGLIFWAAMTGLTPAFFVQGRGGTPVRQVVLLLAVLSFAGVAWRMIHAFWRQSGAFYYWYGLGLALVATGLTGVMLLSVQGGALGWANRLTQYLGSAYLFIAAMVAVRERRPKAFSLSAVDEAMQRFWAGADARRHEFVHRLFRYGLAVVAVAAAMGLRAAATAWLGPGLPAFITFYPAVMVAALFGGFGPGALATALSAFAAGYWILPPQGQFAIDAPIDRLGLAIFATMGLSLSLLSDLYRHYRARAARADRETAVRDTEAQVAALASAIFDGVVESENGRIVNCNAQFARTVGYSIDELRGMGAAEMVAPADRERILAAIRDRREVATEHAMLRKDGSQIIVETHGRPVAPGSNRRITAIRDITRRKEAEQALRLSEEKFAQAFANNPAAIAMSVLETGQLLAVNDTWVALTGYSREEVIGRSTRELPVWPTPEDRLRFVQELRAKGAVRGWEQTFHNKSGGSLVTQLSAQILSVQGEQLVLSTLVDITPRKRAEEALQAAKLQAEKAQAAAETASAAKDHFLAVLSHELRTPLNPALMAATILEGSPLLPPDLREDVSVIRRNVELEARLIDDLLDLTRIARGKLTLNRRIVDGRQVLQHAIETCHAEVVEKGLALEVSVPDEPAMVDVDPARLQQVYWNLLKNAIKFTPEHGRISVTATASEQGSLRVQVSDTGKGIDPEALPLIFDAFEQGGVHVTKRYGGLGLGLAICKGLVGLLDGSITAASDGPGKGATFTVILPIAQPVPRMDAEPPTPQSAIRDPQSLHILLVEDHESTAILTARLLESFGHRVTTANCVKCGLEKFTSERFDLVISDLGLPDGTGHDLVRQLLAQRPIPAIALSGYGMDNDLQESADAGFLEHLVKPINARQLEDAISRALAR